MKRYAVLLAAVATPSLAFASPGPLATIESECGTQLKLSPAGCACIKGKAAALSDGQQAFVAAVVSKDKQKELMQDMTVRELTEAGTFMSSAPAQCGNAQ
jgi:hypothetical protein